MDLEQIKNSKSDYDFLYQLLLKKRKAFIKNVSSMSSI